MNFAIVVSYIDPFSGTILLQVIVAGAVGAVAFFRRTIWKCVRLVFGRKGPDADGSHEDPTT